MPILDIFSKRQKQLRGEVADVFQYVDIPNPLRVQIVHLWDETIGSEADYWRGYSQFEGNVKGAYEAVVEALCREYGQFRLAGGTSRDSRDFREELIKFLLETADAEKCLDAVELSFRLINGHIRSYDYLGRRNAAELADGAIAELNHRFKEHGVGYQFVDGEILRVDSELLHVEVVKPALRLLNDHRYAGVQQEFLKAHEHYRTGNGKEALNECLKAFESIMKAICDKREWTYPANATAKTLVQICFDNGLVPDFWQQSFVALKSLLESSVPTGRNKLGGHGQGGTPTTVPDYLVAYMLHMTASAIVFLGEAEVALP